MRIPFGVGILQRRNGVGPKDDPRDVLDLLHREGIRGGVPGGEGDDARVRCVFQDLTDGAGLEGGHSVADGIIHNIHLLCKIGWSGEE